MRSFKEYIDQIKSSSLGIDRSLMPQIPKDKYSEFINFVRDKGILVEEKLRLSPDMLNPVQQTYKDIDTRTLIDITDMSRPILISKDNYILDGHHRWLVGKLTKLKTVLVTIINININEALNMAREFEELSNDI